MKVRFASEDGNLSEARNLEVKLQTVSAQFPPSTWPRALLAGEHWAGGRLQNATSQPIFWGSEWFLRALEKCKRLACMWFLLTWGVLGRLHTLHGNGAELRSAANRHKICFPWYSAFSSMEALSLVHAFVTIITR